MTAGAGYDGFSTAKEMDILRQRMKQDRQRADKERLELLSAMQEAMGEAKARQQEQEASMRRHTAFLRRCRAEADVAKANFESDMRRRQAFFDQSAAHAARREAERAEYAEEQQRRREAGHPEHEYGLPGVVSSRPPLLISTPQHERQYVAFEGAFSAFEAARSDAPCFNLATFPWPPASCPVSGLRKGDSADKRKAALKAALLRWHPDKFAAAHGGKLVEADAPAIMEKVNAVLRRVQMERAACAEADEAGVSLDVPMPSTQRQPSAGAASSSPDRRAAAAAAARYMPTTKPRMPATRATGPKVVRPSRAAAAAAAADPIAAGPRSSKYEGRFD